MELISCEHIMDSKRVYNTVAKFGQLSIGLQGLSSFFFAILLLITGSAFLGVDRVRVPAIVDDIVCDDKGACGVAVSYIYGGMSYGGTFETMRQTGYSVGDTIYVSINPTDPTTVAEDLPWKTLGLGMILGALALGYLVWYTVQLVSDNRNMAALAGTLSFLRFLVV